LYEVVPAHAAEVAPVVSVDELKYQKRAVAEGRKSEDRGRRAESAGQKTEGEARKAELAEADDASRELLTVKIRYKEPAGDVSKKLEFPLVDAGRVFAAASGDFKFAAAVAGFGLALRSEPMKSSLLVDAARWAEEGSGDDPGGYRAEFGELVRQAQVLVQ
jgi:Ca-activated chloride channel family protein